MKRLIIAVILILLASAVFVAAVNIVNQDEIMVEYATDTLSGAKDSTVYYVLFQPTKEGARYSTSVTAPALTNTGERQIVLNRYNSTGSIAISLYLTYVTAEESDSLWAYFEPYVWDGTQQAFKACTTQRKYLIFDTVDSYVSTSRDVLNWTSAAMYTTTLAGRTLPFSGIKVTVVAWQIDTANADTKCDIGFWFVK